MSERDSSQPDILKEAVRWSDGLQLLSTSEAGGFALPEGNLRLPLP
jgi:hypothetical protein